MSLEKKSIWQKIKDFAKESQSNLKAFHESDLGKSAETFGVFGVIGIFSTLIANKLSKKD